MLKRNQDTHQKLLALKSDYDALIRLAFRIQPAEQQSQKEKIATLREEYYKLTSPDIERNEHFLDRITKLKLEIQDRYKKKVAERLIAVVQLFKDAGIISESDCQELIVIQKTENKVMPSNVENIHHIPQPKVIKVEDYIHLLHPDKNISIQLAEFVKQQIESEESIKKKIEAASRVDKIFRKVDFSKFDPECEVEYSFYGSYVNQFSTKSSDIDISLSTNLDKFEERELLAFFLAAIMPDLNKMKPKPKIEKILNDTARVPVVEIGFEDLGITVSFSVNNKLGAINSEMIKLYAELDPRCQMLGLLVKLWANAHNVISARLSYISSYAYNMLVINFLQTVKPPVLPSLQALRADEEPATLTLKKPLTKDKFVARVDYEKDHEKLAQIMKEKYSKNKMCVVELLRRFFRFYKNRKNVENIVLSVREGRHLPREELKEDSKFLYSIEDPFDITHNPGRYLVKTGDRAKTLLDEMEESYELLKEGKVLEIFKTDD